MAIWLLKKLCEKLYKSAFWIQLSWISIQALLWNNYFDQHMLFQILHINHKLKMIAATTAIDKKTCEK